MRCIKHSIPCRSGQKAFTRAELVATLAALFLCAGVLLPGIASSGSRSKQVGCLNNLRQIGIAFHAWGSEHDDHRPWFVPTNEGGTRGDPRMNDAYIHFTALSNYMSPVVLIDPAEVGGNKRMAQNWSFSPEGGFLNGAFRNNALSYVLGVHSLVSQPGGILTADRNMAFNRVVGSAYGFAQVFQINYQLNYSPDSFRGWTNGIHGTFGNVLLNDGRVEFTTSERLHAVLVGYGASSGQFLAPFF